jgi:hypothetical protein
MDDAVVKRWDLVVKIVGLGALIASGIWTLYKFREDRQVDLRNRAEEVRRDEAARSKELNSFVFQRQTELYFEAAKIAATIATSKDPKSVSEAKLRFNQLYFGEFVIVEDRRVELAMIAFYSCTLNDDCSRRRVDQHNNPINGGQIDREPIENLALDLSACIRDALEQDRGIQFGNLAPAETKCPYDRATTAKPDNDH